MAVNADHLYSGCENVVCVVMRKVALDLVGHRLLDCLLDAMYDHFISYPY
jgi:hypothetical protein